MPSSWVSDYESAVEVANDTLTLIQERELKHGGVGPEASRLAATARRKLGTLGTLIENLRTTLELNDDENLLESERNRRRDNLAALRAKREQMLQSLRREHPRSGVSTNSQLQGKAKETDTTAELDNHGLINLQQQIMSQQDTELDQLEQSVVTTKHVALQINEETTLHNRLLDELDGDVETTGNRLRVVQQKLKLIMGRSGSCKFYLLIGLLLLLLMLFIVLGFKLAVYFVKL